MREPAPDYTSRHYERPNQKWVCGLACDGHACPAGPTARGRCPELAECVPIRDGDRWKCNRTEYRGGECDDGPTPDGECGCVRHCKPVRSLRVIRGRFITACTLLVVGALVVVLNANCRDDVISPGPLARQHAQLLNDHGDKSAGGDSIEASGSCAACHSAADRNVAGWTVSLTGFHGGGNAQSQLCMNCHKTEISEKFAMSPHNVDDEMLHRLTVDRRNAKVKAAPGSAGGTTGDAITRRFEPPAEPGAASLACAVCHREHQGAEFNLAAISDAACQACHQQRYESFSSDHPDFGSWPYERRTRIAFNHASHRAKHFVEKNREFDCRSCHMEDATQSAQLTANYETACASCHDEKISLSVAKGVPMFLLPTLDVDALQESGYEIGAWPEDATGDFDGRLPPAMKLLLAGDTAAATAMRTLGADFEFFDVDPDDTAQLAACATIATSVKKLFAELAAQDQAALRGRMKAALGREVTNAEVQQLLSGIPPELLSNAIGKWFPELKPAEPATQAAASEPLRNATTEAAAIHYDPVGTWSRDEATFSIRYQPAAHADPVLAGWLDVLSNSPELLRQPVASAMFKELSSVTAPGLCASCHSIDRTTDGGLAVNWHAYDRSKEPRPLTKFSHKPHLLLPQLSDCTSCHSINNAADRAAAYAGHDQYAFTSEFAAISKSSCVQCHTTGGAGESCQTCHNYHVDGIEEWRFGSSDCTENTNNSAMRGVIRR